MIRGRARFDGLALGELEAIFMPQLRVVAKAAFVDSTSGKTHGWTTHADWSPEVIAKLAELRALMEQDLARLHFANAGDVAEPARAEVSTALTGLLEHVLGDVPSI